MIINGEYVYGIIYKITNTIDNKCYIGQTKNKRGFAGRYYHKGKTNAERVYNYHKRMKELGSYYNAYLLNAMEKYGYEAFDVCEVLDTAMSSEELDEKEMHYIQYYDSYNNGYNMTLGGEKGCGENQPKGKDNPLSVAVCQLTLDGELVKIWDSLADIRRDSEYNVPNIEQVCSGINTKAYNYLWVFKRDYDPKKNYKWNPPSCYRAIVLLDDNYNVVNEYYSVAEAARVLHIDRKTVRDTCNNVWEKPKYNLMYRETYNTYIEEQRLSGETL